MQVLQCVLFIFHVIHHVLPYSRSYCVWFSFATILNFHALLQVVQCAFLIYPVFPYFVPHTRSNNVCVSFSTFFQCSCHNPGSIMCISHFSRFWLFLTVFQVIQCLCLILQLLMFSRNNTGPILCISRFFFSHSFLPHSRSYSVCFSLFTIFIFLAMLQDLECAFLIFRVFESFSPI
jgi:hypothetical protein